MKIKPTNWQIATTGLALASTACNSVTAGSTIFVLAVVGGVAAYTIRKSDFYKAHRLYSEILKGNEGRLTEIIQKAELNSVYLEIIEKLAGNAISGASPRILSYFNSERLQELFALVSSNETSIRNASLRVLKLLSLTDDDSFLKTFGRVLFRSKIDISDREELLRRLAEKIQDKTVRSETMTHSIQKKYTPQYISAYDLLHYLFPPDATDPEKHLRKIANQGEFWGAVAIHVIEDKELHPSTPFPLRDAKQTLNGQTLLTRLGHLSLLKQKYVLVQIGREFQFRVGAQSHQEMVIASAARNDGEDPELIVGAGFIWLDHTTNGIRINGDSKTFPTQLDHVQSEYFEHHLFSSTEVAGLNAVRNYLKQNVFSSWSSLNIEIDYKKDFPK